MNGVSEIRSAFLGFFQKNDHRIVESSSLVPTNDPTLMFTAAGMVQFKNMFLGLETREYRRAVTTQKCVRAGGKHNDLDNVGYTSRHHTFFEMLGNFSFGDYFKEHAIELAWKLVTQEFDLSPERLLVTVYHEDDEATQLWKKIAGISDDKIIPIATSDNFWAMGDTGPCGPCSEIYFDHGDKVKGGPPGSKEEDGDRFVEIWNLVFMQYEQTPDKRVSLPTPSVDTGMGLERIAAVMQGTHDNYEIDLFQNLIAAVEEEIQKKATKDNQPSFRVIADHLRAAAFLVSDGVMPSNEGRGYVLRRIMRRAMRHASLVGAEEPLMWKLVDALRREMGDAYPQLKHNQPLIVETLKLEETRFQKTLAKGLSLLEDQTKNLGEGDMLDGNTAFKLYDTYGFPLDLTQDALRRRGIQVDVDAYDVAMQNQKEEARASWQGSGATADQKIWFEVAEKYGKTEFLGYNEDKAEAELVTMVKDGEETNKATTGQEVILVFRQTPFYAEAGGQVGDRGIVNTNTALMFITDTKKYAGVYAHYALIMEGVLEVGDTVPLGIDVQRRDKLRANHSATHIIHQALRDTLGEHVAQKGSLVAHDKLRFDFAHNKQVTQNEAKKIFGMVNACIQKNTKVTTMLMDVEEAKKSGAQAQFGEKYGQEVRVVGMGEVDSHGKPWSLELCGGTHVRRTGEIGPTIMVSESAVSSGVRRIEALTGNDALEYLLQNNEALTQIKGMLGGQSEDIVERVQHLVDENKRMKKEILRAKKNTAVKGANEQDQIEQIGDVRFIGKVVDGVNPKELKGIVDELKQKIESGIVVVATETENQKGSVVVGVTNDLTNRYNAVEMVNVASKHLGGKEGGGRPDMAQAGGANTTKKGLAEAVKQVGKFIQKNAA